MELTAQDIQNILSIMGRSDLKGSEANAYITAEMKLRVLLKNLVEAQGPAPTETTEVPKVPVDSKPKVVKKTRK